MKACYSRNIACAVVLFSMTVALSFGMSEGEKTKVKGFILTRTADTLTLKTATSGNVTVVLDDDTKVQQPKGLGIRKKQLSAAVLVPGLKVSVDGVGDAEGRVTAYSITFDADDLQTAEMIQAGLTPTNQKVATNEQNIASNAGNIETNKQGIQANGQQIAQTQHQADANTQEIQAANKRFSELTDYDSKGNVSVNFAAGSYVISSDGKAALTSLAAKAVDLSGYIIEVKGFADSSGNAAMNEQLSMNRAQAVISYLIQNCKVPVRHIVAPGAMGTADPAAPNETAQGRAANRRVEVTVLVNRALAGE